MSGRTSCQIPGCSETYYTKQWDAVGLFFRQAFGLKPNPRNNHPFRLCYEHYNDTRYKIPAAIYYSDLIGEYAVNQEAFYKLFGHLAKGRVLVTIKHKAPKKEA